MNRQQRPADHALRAEAVVEHAAGGSADVAGESEDDAEQAELRGAPAEHARGVDAAKGEHRAEPVGIEHAGKEEERDLPVVAVELLHAADELRDAGLDRRGRARSRRGPA